MASSNRSRRFLWGAWLMTTAALIWFGVGAFRGDKRTVLLPGETTHGHYQIEVSCQSHVGYGVQDSHYDTVGAALLWTLGQGLGDAFTDEVEAAWTKVYTTLATVMKEAAAELPLGEVGT